MPPLYIEKQEILTKLGKQEKQAKPNSHEGSSIFISLILRWANFSFASFPVFQGSAFERVVPGITCFFIPRPKRSVIAPQHIAGAFLTETKVSVTITRDRAVRVLIVVYSLLYRVDNILIFLALLSVPILRCPARSVIRQCCKYHKLELYDQHE